MNQASFVKKNIERWEQFESWLNDLKAHDPDELASLYLQLTDDLSYARTHFRDGEITHYLNNLATKAHSKIYRNRREKTNRFIHFWKYEVPQVCYNYRRHLLYSLLVFTIATAIGALSAANDPDFLRLILSDDYVNMTEANIAKGDPMAVYKSGPRTDMFLAITLNNVRVSLTVFAMGIFTAIASGVLLLYNGVMLGSFQYFFFERGLLIDSALTIWIHGTLEIAAIILAGGAGFILGNSFLFPGTYSRLVALRKGAKDGLKLIIGLVPIFGTAGFLEGFITRLTGAPILVKLFIILGSAAFILFYFVIYPTKLYKNGQLPHQN